MNIKQGQQFPNFSGRTFDGNYIDFSELRGKQIVVYFYPKDNTPGCTLECQEFSELLNEFHKHNTEVVGVSVDSLESHKKFVQRYNMKVSLISDSDKTLVQRLGIMRESGSAMRTTFVLDEQGLVRKIYENVNPNGHAHVVLGYIKSSMEPSVQKEIKPVLAVKKEKNASRSRKK